MMPRGRGGRDGYILVAVLAVAVILTGFIAAGSLVMRSALGAARVADADVASAGLLSSGVEMAAYQLAVLKVSPDLVDGRRIRFTDGVVTPHVSDEAGKIDLNAAGPKLLAGVFAGIGMDEATAAAVVRRIVELRGPPNGVIAGGFAPGAGLPGAGLPNTAGAADPGREQASAPAGGLGSTAAPAGNNAPPKRRGLQSVEDLRDIEGVRRDDMRLLRQRLTVYNPDGRLNVMTAAPDVLMSMPGMTQLKLTQVLAARDSGSEAASADAQAVLGGDFASFIKASPGPAYTVRVDAAEKSGRRKSVEAVIAASKSPNQPYYILSWRE